MTSLLLRLIANDAELFEQLVSIDDDVAVRQLRNLANLFLLQRVDELQVDVRIAGASIQRRTLSANPFRDRSLLDRGGLRRLLFLNEIGVGRLARLRITLQDRPGALYKVMKEFDAHNVNIIEIYHQRIFTSLPAKGLITDIECEARDKEQIDALVSALRSGGYAVSLVELG